MTIFSKRRVYHSISLLFFIILVTACSSTRLIYSFTDKFIKDEINYFLYLDEEEKLLMNQQVSEMINWHSTSMMPSYAAYLDNIADTLEVGEYDANKITIIIDEGRTLIEDTIVGLTPHASRFLIRINNDEAIEFMKKQMLMRQQERIIKLSEPRETRYKDRLNKLTTNFKRFFGDLTDAQIEMLETHSNETLNDSRVRLHNRTLRQKVFVRFMKSQPNEAELNAYLNKLLISGHEIINPNYKDFSQTSLSRFKTLLIKMLAISSKKQRNTMISKLRNYAREFNTISK